MPRDQLAYSDLATDRQRRSYDIVREHHALVISHVGRQSLTLADALPQVPKFIVGHWAWVYNAAATLRQGLKAGTDFKTLKVKKIDDMDGPLKSLGVGPFPFGDTPNGSLLGAKLLSFALPFDMPGVDHRRGSVARYKPCASTPTRVTTCRRNVRRACRNTRPHNKSPTPRHSDRFPFNASKWRISLVTSQIAVEAGLSRRCRRHIGQDSLAYPENRKGTSNSLTIMPCSTGPSPPVGTAKPTVSTA